MCKKLIILITSILSIQTGFGQMEEFEGSNELTIVPYSLCRELIESEKITESEYFNPSSDTISIKKIITEIKTVYQTEDVNWHYTDNSWWYKNRRVDMFPPSYKRQTISKSHISEFNKEKNNYTSSTEKEELIEYFKIEDGWNWNEKLMKWEAKDDTTSDYPKYRIIKTVSFK